jgi:putative transposase
MPLVCTSSGSTNAATALGGSPSSCTSKGQPCGVDRVAKLLKMQGLQAIQPQSFKPQDDQQPAHAGLQSQPASKVSSPRAAQSRLGRRHHLHPSSKQPALPIWLCLLDLCSRRVVGWSLARADDRDARPRCPAARDPRRQPPPGLIHHSDRGGQYASQALSRRAAPRRDPPEHEPRRQLLRQRLHGILLRHHQDRTRNDRIRNSRQARSEIASYLAYYNTDRRHSSLDYLSPSCLRSPITQSFNHSTVRNLPSSSATRRAAPDFTAMC